MILIPIVDENGQSRSSNVEAVGWEKWVLTVLFKGGKMYRYLGVPADVAWDLVNASSVGKQFNYAVKGKYEWYEVKP